MGAPQRTSLAFLLLALALLAPGIVAAAAAPADPCARLCAHWVLDAAASDDAAALLQEALAGVREPKPRRRSSRNLPPDFASGGGMVIDLDALQPERPPLRERLAEELRPQFTTPPTLTVRIDGDDVVLDAPGWVRRLRPGEPHARVDQWGTARISTSWQRGALLVEESYDGRNRTREEQVLSEDGSMLVVTRRVKREGLPREVAVRSTYRRSS